MHHYSSNFRKLNMDSYQSIAYMGGISYEASFMDIERFFSKFHCNVRKMKLFKGFAFVYFFNQHDADRAIGELDRKILLGQVIRLEYPRGDVRKYYNCLAVSNTVDKSKYVYRLKVGNLAQSVSWQALKQFMQQAGIVVYADAHRFYSSEGVVQYSTRHEMMNALMTLNGKILHDKYVILHSPKIVPKKPWHHNTYCFKNDYITSHRRLRRSRSSLDKVHHKRRSYSPKREASWLSHKRKHRPSSSDIIADKRTSNWHSKRYATLEIPDEQLKSKITRATFRSKTKNPERYWRYESEEGNKSKRKRHTDSKMHHSAIPKNERMHRTRSRSLSKLSQQKLKKSPRLASTFKSISVSSHKTKSVKRKERTLSSTTAQNKEQPLANTSGDYSSTSSENLANNYFANKDSYSVTEENSRKKGRSQAPKNDQSVALKYVSKVKSLVKKLSLPVDQLESQEPKLFCSDSKPISSSSPSKIKNAELMKKSILTDDAASVNITKKSRKAYSRATNVEADSHDFKKSVMSENRSLTTCTFKLCSSDEETFNTYKKTYQDSSSGSASTSSSSLDSSSTTSECSISTSEHCTGSCSELGSSSSKSAVLHLSIGENSFVHASDVDEKDNAVGDSEIKRD